MHIAVHREKVGMRKTVIYDVLTGFKYEIKIIINLVAIISNPAIGARI